MRKKILGIHIRSSYDVLSIFLKELYMGFEQQGYEVDEIVLDEHHSLRDAINRPFHLYEFVFSINSALLDELAFYLPATVPAVAYLVDHPIEQDGRVRNACPTYLVAHCGRYRAQYADEIYKNINENTFIPHGGSKGTVDIPYEDREYNVVLLGGYERPERILEKINALPDQLPEFNRQLINVLVSDETISWGAAIKQVCRDNAIELDSYQLGRLGVKTFQADNFFRMYCREAVVKSLIEQKIYVDVFGNGWENLDCENKEYVRIHEPVSYEEALNIMGNSKIVLNVAPTHNAGGHERIFSAMLNGAICFTNYSSYISEAGLEEMLVPYSIHQMNLIPDMVRMILDAPAAAKDIAQRAQKCALENHTWMNRAKDIIEFVENYKHKHHYDSEKRQYKCLGERQFGELCAFIAENSQEQLFEKMKCCMLSFLGDRNGRMKRALQSYNNYGYWGKCLDVPENYELLENRACAMKTHLEDFIWVYEHVEDQRSKDVIYGVLRHWLDYVDIHLQPIIEREYDQYFDPNIVQCTEDEVFVDLGAYTGDTVTSYLKNFGDYKKIYCYDIDEDNLEICKDNFRTFDNIEYRQVAVGEKEGFIYFRENSDSSANGISDTGETKIRMVSLDNDISEPITFLKMDIEGSETQALLGARNHIINEHPKLAISIYHNNEDLWKIAKIIHEMDPSYKFYIRYYGGALYPNEYILYAI